MIRDEAFRASYERLRQIAGRAVRKGFTYKTALLTCIMVDSHWRSLVEALMPGQEKVWQAHRDVGSLPFARGYSPRELLEKVIVLDVPSLAPHFKKAPPPGELLVIACDDEGASLYSVAPRDEPS